MSWPQPPSPSETLPRLQPSCSRPPALLFQASSHPLPSDTATLLVSFSCYDMSHQATPGQATPCHAASLHAILSHAMLRHSSLGNAALCHAMPSHRVFTKFRVDFDKLLDENIYRILILSHRRRRVWRTSSSSPSSSSSSSTSSFYTSSSFLSFFLSFG